MENEWLLLIDWKNVEEMPEDNSWQINYILRFHLQTRVRLNIISLTGGRPSVGRIPFVNVGRDASGV